MVLLLPRFFGPLVAVNDPRLGGWEEKGLELQGSQAVLYGWRAQLDDFNQSLCEWEMVV